jgi:hypothetical protein
MGNPVTVCHTRFEARNRAVIKTAGDVPLGDITVDTIKAGRDRRAAAPHAANNFLKSMRRFFKWAADLISCAQNVSAVTSTSGSSMSQERVWLRSLVRSFAKSTRTK